MSKITFETFLVEQNDVIDNAFHDALSALASSGDDLEWDMEKIGDLIDCAEAILKEHGVESCHPYYESGEETPCYLGTDCTNKVCLYKELLKEV